MLKAIVTLKNSLKSIAIARVRIATTEAQVLVTFRYYRDRDSHSIEIRNAKLGDRQRTCELNFSLIPGKQID
ncbi:MAG: hypothetical protein SW833_19225 [Cyanobacteriota bacterium]|nr:hypothetical protein [Cyanobacteriota bacterium]